MKNTKLTALGIISLGLFSLNVNAKDDTNDAPDPADVTRVISSIKVAAGTNSNDNDFAIETEFKLGGSFNSDNNFLTMISINGANKDSDPYEDGFELREARARWFQVFGTGIGVMPKAGYSLDYIDRSNDDSEVIDNIIAAGAIFKVPVLKNWTVYPNVAAVQANVKDEYKVPGSDDGVGIQVNIFNSIYLSKKGTYLMVNPQYSYIDFDNYTTQDLLIETILGTPISDNKRWWLNATYKETFSDIDSDNKFISSKSFKANDDKRQFRIGVTYYF
ncbi:hypothetical protein VIOR3934_07408 [Vibrio orientalis CIP 102891 = ATCC 33934]|uniref:Outer membrane protein beta-barrel domain-containing protein n=1 Tax=Vibrio orientalis CIP 102891 = ATCC 33934 TaxID=675816 RepID=C9QLV4_VIBOR|nr:hypothetical protein [Vibrio orientalis]EEX92880.1 hypothetical protein VIA_003525 [Vibrio orientalis CIP 102891 = ATCC 33934]EGU46562.1 hypothetical protein VIOR3934_07408 [Vibrio orientalis CIP 102891 = ATCC 33934]